ncbi:MAG: hypothetical protein A3G34_10230 [Candidatus Lindowbacteria bacterium RIFCSPLOWO2_12_FULL_62_27]|nr:MAG: hypothetical protein A3G34_10230 [Candidatus Lindowbacteria bacterium RIFCSPLOWO2_12_FULL_62_27]OGH61615.1 MAG: hypothetical protein A3I06_03240 [Candidatus Lindowbacteria bacterium RIFCSPLOWO2_02_FULL_62_12]
MYSCVAADVKGDSDIPTMDNSALDGFAILYDDVAGKGEEPTKLKIVGSVRAGQVPSRRVSAGEAMRITTGAPIPKGADVVVPVEETREEQNTVYVYRPPRLRGDNIRRAGEDIRRGAVVLRQGDRLGPAEIALAHLAGAQKIPVFEKPVVGLLTSGDELVEPGHKLMKGKVRNVNTHIMAALLEHYRIPCRNFGIVKDNPRQIASAIRSAFGKCHVVVTSAGVSAGQYDFVKTVVEKRLKMKALFYKVRQKPGKPILFARKGNDFLFALPGNPVSTFVTFLLYVRPFVLGMAGFRALDLPREFAEASEPIGGNPRFTNFLRGRVQADNGKTVVRTTGPQESHLVTSLYGSNSLIVLPEGRLSVQPGELLEVWRWR